MPHLLALSNETKTSSFLSISRSDFQQVLHQLAHSEDSDENTCQLIRLDDFVQMNDIQSIDFLKIDTESTEHLVFRGWNPDHYKISPLYHS